eukprot:CAMPEP_0116151002 /NCGR_PEP_ID=MMETSP0329-20121206/19862_1 /TAXON_ID=697910 /ORGANISM="Pseudo-nitzschia arenysensis, Strain B593" /LENGTH=1098 /DNA_ID=CAMNT_0003647581 /DNA_START=94 /DNA_END=3391 /DNA_ORIENTATION=-
MAQQQDESFSETETDNIPLVPSLSYPRSDVPDDSSRASIEDAIAKNMCGLGLPSLKARLELSVDTSNEWQGVSASDSYDDYAVPTDRPFFDSAKSPPTNRKMVVKLDDSKTPTAALSVGKNASSSSMDFEILPDESDEDDDDDFEEDEEDENENENKNNVNTEKNVETSKKEQFQKSAKRIEELETGDDHAKEEETTTIKDQMTIPTSPTDLEANRELIRIPADASPAKPMSRRRFLFAPKSPRSQHISAPKSPRSQNNPLNFSSNTSSQYSSADASTLALEREKPRGGQRLTTMIRKMKASRKENRKADDKNFPDLNLVDSGLDEQDSSSDESSFDDEEDWSDEESQLFDDDVDKPMDCSALHSSLPKSFLDLPPDVYDYLDTDLVTEIEHQDVFTYSWEHHLFTKGLLQLLAERDLIGVEDDVLDANNVLKMGVLRKKDAKIGWRVKYVEVRKGNLTYFDNKGNETGRTIHLRKRRCVCRAGASNKEGGQDFVFELVVDGGRRLLWTAKSEEERHGWIRAINQAMIGEVDDSRDIPLDLSLYRNAIDDYQTIHSSLKEVHTRQEYLVAMNTLLYRQTSSSALRVPMKWIRDNYLKEESKEEPLKDHERIKHVVREFWKNLCNTSVVLNGHSVEADGIYSGERVIGALSRCILEFDKVENTTDFDQVFNSLKRSRREGNTSITELQAVLYARNILNGALKSSSGGDIQKAVEELFRNDSVAHAELERSEPLQIYVSYAGDDFSESKPQRTEFVGWIETKAKKSKKWKRRYFVLSEGVVSYFERANPRPNRLSGQMVLRDAKFKILEGNILSVVAQNRERLLRFSDRGELIKWKSIMDDKGNNADALMEQDLEKYEEARKDLDKIEAQLDLEKMEAQKDLDKAENDPETIDGDKGIEKVDSQREGSDEDPLLEAPSKDDLLNPSREQVNTTYSDENIANGIRLGRVRGAGAKFLKKAALAKKKAQDTLAKKREKGARIKSIRTGAGLFIRGVRGNTEESTNDMLVTSTRNLNAEEEKKEPTVQAVVEMNSTFRVYSKDSNSEEEILLIVRVKLYQAFLLSGGTQGRLVCGDELLLMECSAGEGAEDVQNVFFQPPTSL